MSRLEIKSEKNIYNSFRRLIRNDSSNDTKQSFSMAIKRDIIHEPLSSRQPELSKEKGSLIVSPKPL